MFNTSGRISVISGQVLPIHLAVIALAFGIGTEVSRAQVQLNIQSGVQLGWPAPNTTNSYYLQWSPISGATWTDLVMAVAGDGTTHTFFDPVPSGSRQYQDLEIVPGTPPSFASPANGGFEAGSGISAGNWTVDTAAGGPVYAVRTNDSPHGGSFDFQVHLASTGAGPVVEFNQTDVPVTGGKAYPFAFYAKALAGSLGQSSQWRILWNAGGDTGYQTFNLTAGSDYALISNTVTAPAAATSATIYFHFAGAAIPAQSANIDIDDVVFGSGSSSPGTPPETNILAVTSRPMIQISWPSASGVQYFPESTANLSTAAWNTNSSVIVGDGTTKSFLAATTNGAMFFRLFIPPVVVLPPTGLHLVPTGTTKSLNVAWTASVSPGVTDYRLFYGDTNGTTTNILDLGNVTSTVLSGLTPGETYFVSIITISANGQSEPATMQAQVSTNTSGVVWSDEFNGSAIDPGTWTYDTGGGGFGNGQFENDTARHENSYVTNGTLVIEARRENYLGNSFTSARMLTQGRFAYMYGDLEARVKLPNTANGLWPAFWLMGNNAGAIVWPACGEVDVLEMGSAAGIAQGIQQELIDSAVHYSNATNGYSNYVTWLTNAADLTQDYHLYKMSWTPTTISFYLDGVQYGSFDITADYLSEFHQPMFPILNIAVGGYNPSYTGVYSPAGVTATMPARMYVDWIRLSNNGFTRLYFGDNASESGNFGVFTETTPVNDSLTYTTNSDPNTAFAYSNNAALYIWNNMTPSANPPPPSEGSTCWSFDIAGGNWFGMGVFLPNFRNMMNYSDGYLHFDIRTTAGDATSMQVGIKSCRGGEFWLPLGTDQTSEFGFARDGQWHSLKIPLNRFANTDFRTMSQFFMISSVGNAPSAMNLSIDNVWWEPSAARVTPQNGDFGVYTETASHQTAGSFTLGLQGNFFIWANTMVPGTQNPYEGTQDISLQSAGLGWTGMAFTPNIKYNLSAFRYPGSQLQFAMKTTTSTTFMIGMKSGNIDGVGQKWITFQSGSDPYGFVRDGNWHVVSIPISDFEPEVDLTAVSQFFEILSTDAAVSSIELDDIHFANGGVASPPDQ
ncbi:MAG TPA: family 16 glycosylhydrolase [Verrucomicrobiae bacterium]|nr:family 16 glycosylhydrolase [Verrucomicrobiae bacterium]